MTSPDYEFREAIEEIKRKISLVDYIGRRVPLTKAGRNHKGLCPFHNEKTPSFTVFADNGYKCFGCDEHGDVFDFVQRSDSVEFGEALRRLAPLAGVELPSVSPVQQMRMKQRRAKEDILTEAARFYHKQLMSVPKALEYLSGRGVTEESIDRFGIGFASAGATLKKYLLAEGYSLEMCIEAGVLSDPSDATQSGQAGQIRDSYWSHIIFPFWSSGRVVDMIGRSLDDAGPWPKYLRLPSPKKYLYNEGALRSESLCIVEGLFDCIALEQAGFSAVALTGTSLSDELVRKFSKCKVVSVMLDPDKAGKEAALKVADALGSKARIVTLPDGLDPDEFALQRGKVAVWDLLARAPKFIDYLIDQIPRDTGKVELADKLEPILERLSTVSKLVADAYLDHSIKSRFGLRREEITSYKDRVKAKKAANNSSSEDRQEGHENVAPYKETPRGLVWLQETRDGRVERQLTNFTARIIHEVHEDDGAETNLAFEIQAMLNGRQKRFKIPAQQFAPMNWHIENLGASSIIWPGMSIKEHARTAIQILSGEPAQQHVYKHTGWREGVTEPGSWVYLHAGGCIGGRGPVSNGAGSASTSGQDDPAQDETQSAVTVHFQGGLEQFCLPEPPEGRELYDAVNASLRFLELGPGEISVPLYAAIWRSAMKAADYSLHLSGHSGEFKTAVGVLMQQHFGSGFDEHHLPGSWSSTENALEELLFVAKDALTLIDDYVPTGGARDVQRLQAKADRVMRAQGNHSGRQRMRADGTLRASRPPRGTAISTGEDIPPGLSLRARMYIVEFSKGAIQVEHLTACQKDGSNGLYARAMSAFLAWLAPRYESEMKAMPAQVERLRDAAVAYHDQHRRQPEIMADLAYGLGTFLRFATEVGAITKERQDVLWAQGWNALLGTARQQIHHQAANEPAQRFLELLSAAIASGKAHFTNPEGGPPSQAQAWGWRTVPLGKEGEFGYSESRPQGDRIGWVHKAEDEADTSVYLILETAYSVVKRVGDDGGEGIMVSQGTLSKRLLEAGHIATVDESRGTLYIRRRFEGKDNKVLHLKASSLGGAKTDKTDKTDNDGEIDTNLRTENINQWPDLLPSLSVSVNFPVKTDNEPPQESDNTTHGEGCNCQFCQFCQFPGTPIGPVNGKSPHNLNGHTNGHTYTNGIATTQDASDWLAVAPSENGTVASGNGYKMRQQPTEPIRCPMKPKRLCYDCAPETRCSYSELYDTDKEESESSDEQDS